MKTNDTEQVKNSGNQDPAVSQEKTRYRAVNRQTGKAGGIPTKDKDMPASNVTRKLNYPDTEVETGEHHPRMGV